MPFVIVVIIGAITTDYAARAVHRGQSRERRDRFISVASDVAAVIQAEIDLSLELLLAIPQLFLSSGEVSREAFNIFVADGLARRPAVYAYEYLVRVSDEARVSFEEAARSEGLPDFEVRDVDSRGNLVRAAQRPHYFPISYLDKATELGVMGVDVLMEPGQGPYAERACAGMGVVSTAPLSLIEDPDEVLSVTAFAPVRMERSPSEGPCDGLAQVVLQIAPLIENAVSARRLEEIGLAITAPWAPAGRRLLYANRAEDGGEESPSVFEHQIRFGQTTWNLAMRPLPGSRMDPAAPAYWVYGVGVVLSVLVVFSVSAMRSIAGLHKRVRSRYRFRQRS